MTYCPISKTKCETCSHLQKKWKIEEIFEDLEEIKGAIDYVTDKTQIKSEDSRQIKRRSLTEKEKCIFKLLLSELTIKEIASHFNFSYNSLRNWLSLTLYLYIKKLAEDLKYSFPNNKFQYYYLKNLLEDNKYSVKSSLSIVYKNNEFLPPLKTIINYVGKIELKNGEVKPKFTVHFEFETKYFSSEIVEIITTILEKMSKDNRWVIVPDEISLDKKITKIFTLSKTRQKVA